MYNKSQILSGFAWSAVEKTAVIVLQLLLEILLARFLSPDKYGVMGIALVFVSLGNLFSESGLSMALIQRQNRSEEDFSTAFYFTFFVAVGVSIAVTFFSGFIATYFKMPDLSGVLKGIAICIVLNAATVIHKTKLTIAIDFKTQAHISFISIILSGIISLYMAYKGFGVYALVAQLISQSVINFLLYNTFLRWYPKAGFSLVSFKSLFSFGSNLLLAGLLQNFYLNLYNVIIGKKNSAFELGLYSKSNQFTQMPCTVITGIFQRVAFPYYSSFQDNDKKLYDLNLQYTKIICLAVFPLFTYISAFSFPLVSMILSNKWIQVAPVISILSMSYMTMPLIVNNMTMFQVKNKTKLFFRVEFLTKIIGLIILFGTINYGITVIVAGICLQLLIQTILTSYISNKLLGCRMKEQLRIITKLFLFSAILLLLFKNIIGANTNYLYIIMYTFVFFLFYVVLYLFFYYKDLKFILSLINTRNR